MSSLRNVIKRREHKERGQPRARQKLGLLEKHKDYVLRARDYHDKQKRLTALRRKAAMRNPDEFHRRMVESRTDEGVHVSTHNHMQTLDADALRTLKTQDLAYLHMKRAVDLRKAEKLTRGLHFVDAPRTNRHTIFVEEDDAVDTFDLAQHFDTAPELVDRAFNRLRTHDLATAALPDVATDRKLKYKMQVEKDAMYRELRDRLTRAKKLGHMSAKLDLERKVQAKGKKRKVQDAANGLPAVYRWKQERQK
ncbi:hypothetical protein PsorP6_016120 [Peronosclerospora sorghi]|uniref:Uncharacterized protein n=1 Tax=Peronosclerospora sorghi TaxID=230839 RepID=A0ACC0VSH7_9STRA|nr:hypothetical protein PsorP6_016120 [Peronosclerospora sorghi]